VRPNIFVWVCIQANVSPKREFEEKHLLGHKLKQKYLGTQTKPTKN